jgi:hypothetical protein
MGGPRRKATPAPAPAPVAVAPPPAPEPLADKENEERVLGQGKAYRGRARGQRSVLGEAATVTKKTLLGG